jgi:hypothetical protein
MREPETDCLDTHEFLTSRKGDNGDRVEAGVKGIEMTQTMYAHMNK